MMTLSQFQPMIMMHGNLLNEIGRVDNLLAANSRKLTQADLNMKDARSLRKEKKRLEKYRADLLEEWRHLNP